MLEDFAAADRHGTATFTISAFDCPQLLCRVLGYVAQQGRYVDAIVGVREADRLRILISLSAIDGGRAELLAQKFRALIDVDEVQLAFAVACRGSDDTLPVESSTVSPAQPVNATRRP